MTHRYQITDKKSAVTATSATMSCTNINNKFEYGGKGNKNTYTVNNNVNVPSAKNVQVFFDLKTGNKLSESSPTF